MKRSIKSTWYKMAACMMTATLVGYAAITPAQVADAHFVLVSHAPDSDLWWNTIKNAVKQADEDFNVTTDYRNPPNGDMADMSSLIEQAAARNYDGVIVSIGDYDVLKTSVAKVTAKQIPLVTINSGTEEQSAQLHAIMHIGQPDYVAGKAAGEKAKAAGMTSFLCVNLLRDQPDLVRSMPRFRRCHRRGLEIIHARFRHRSDRDSVEGQRVFAQSSGHERHSDARAEFGVADHQGASAKRAARQDFLRDVRLFG